MNCHYMYGVACGAPSKIPVDSFHHEPMFFYVVYALANDHGQRNPVVTAISFNGHLQRNTEYGTVFHRV